MIHEVIITSLNEDGTAHIAPMGVTHADDLVQIAPFKPSRTLENILRTRTAVINRTDDVLIFAGCLTGRHEWPTTKTSKIGGLRLVNCRSHLEVEVQSMDGDEIRPRFYCKSVHEEIHSSFKGFNRAQAAVLEAAILVSRLGMIEMVKIENEIEYLQIAIDKTAGEKERTAWGWLMDKINQFKLTQVENV